MLCICWGYTNCKRNNGTAITVTETQPATRVWKSSQTTGTGYTPFTPAQTGLSLTPVFNTVSPNYVICESTNSANDKVVSQEVVIIVTAFNSISENGQSIIKTFWSGNDFIVDLTGAELSHPVVELMNLNGQAILIQPLNPSSLNRIATTLAEGLYIFRIADGTESYSGQTSKK